MPKIIVKTEYIRNITHITNYLEYAGNKLEAQFVVFTDGSKVQVSAEQKIDPANLEKPVREIEIRTKDGLSQLLSVDRYRQLVLGREKTAKKKIIETHDDSGKDVQLDFRPERYIRYISERPGVEKFETGQGLFNITGAVSVEGAQQMARELDRHIWWSHIVSIPREDAVRMGFDDRAAWQNLVRAKALQIANAYNISLENLVLNCAYHDKELNPHIHLFVTSKNRRESFVKGGKEGLTKAYSSTKSTKTMFLF